MKNLSLRRYLVLGLLIAFGAAGALAGCGKKEYPQESVEPVEQDFSIEEEYQQENDEPDGQSFSIGEELQWASDFGWQYFPQEEIADSEIAGCFKTKTSDLQDGDTIEVYHDALSEEALFALINSQAKDLKERYPEGQVVCRMNGSTEIDQFVQLDAETVHRLYLRMNDSVYILYTEMEREKWQDFLEEWLFTSGLQWNGAAVLEESGSVEDTYAYTAYKTEGLWRLFQYEEDCIRIDRNILLFHKQEDGFYFKLESGDEEKKYMEEVVLHFADIDLQHDSWEEAVSYFSDRYPDMYSLEAYLYGEDTLWNFEGEIPDSVFYRVEEPEISHGFFHQNGKTFEVLSQGKSGYYNMVYTMRNNMGYDYYACFLWEREEDGSMLYEDNLEGNYSYVKDLGNEKVVRIQTEIMEIEEGELIDNVIYGVKIVDEKENKVLQELEVNSSYSNKPPFSFEDFNADGYLDLTVEYYYGANGGTASHYIFSPSKEEFVEVDSELDYFGMYGVDSETRRLYMHYHGSAISGTEITYQWKNEMDYEKIKQFDHDSVGDGVQVTILRYENAKEETLSDYLYSQEEYVERLSDIWGTYNEDFIWEKEVTDQTTGKKYTIRYTEVFLPEEAKRNYGIYYDGRIYVYDEDTYLVSVTHSEFISQSESIEWKNGDGDTEQMLEIHYPDGGYSGYPLSVLIVPDYEG
ncbi:MAG: hypothetical protein HDR30_07925 [Lachnospiraceae bacterium]|nr:hypothetical protein [Lachnospiraceae bacterium]